GGLRVRWPHNGGWHRPRSPWGRRYTWLGRRRDRSAGVRSRPAQARRRSNPPRRRPAQPRSTAASRKGRDMTASTADYYGILGLRSDATLTDVKKAYRKLARQHHPDRNNADPGATDRFRRITEAYEYLSAHLKHNPHGPAHPT